MQQRGVTPGLTGERVVALVIVLTTALFLSMTFGEVSAFARQSAGRGPYFFPRIVLIALVFAECFLLWSVFARGETAEARPVGWKFAGLVLATAAYCALIPWAGFLISSVLYGLAVPILLGRRDVLLLAVVSLVYSVALWMLFERVFLIILPASPFDIGF